MAVDNVTMGEIEAHRLINMGFPLATNSKSNDFHEAANQIILLAERIKAERAVVAMQPQERVEQWI